MDLNCYGSIKRRAMFLACLRLPAGIFRIFREDDRMRDVRFLLLVLLGLIACMGAGIIVLAGFGDAGVVASTAGVHHALEVAGQQGQHQSPE